MSTLDFTPRIHKPTCRQDGLRVRLQKHRHIQHGGLGGGHGLRNRHRPPRLLLLLSERVPAVPDGELPVGRQVVPPHTLRARRGTGVKYETRGFLSRRIWIDNPNSILHDEAVHFMPTLPTLSLLSSYLPDPNLNRPGRPHLALLHHELCMRIVQDPLPQPSVQDLDTECKHTGVRYVKMNSRIYLRCLERTQRRWKGHRKL